MKHLLIVFAFVIGGCDSQTQPHLDADIPPPDMNDVDASNELELGPRLRPGRWYVGDFHVHATGASNDTGGDSTPERIKEVMTQLGMEFVVLTDHSNSTGSDPSTREEDPELFNQGPEFPFWERAAELSDANFLMIDGSEMSPTADGVGNFPVGHIGCYPRDLRTFDPNVAFMDRPRGEITGAQTIEQARDAGCYVTLNHPFGPVSWVAFDWTSFDYDAVEIYNGGLGWDPVDRGALDAYMCDISQGRRITALAGSDNHRINEPFPGGVLDAPPGSPQTYVWAQNLAWDELVESLDRGHVTVSDSNMPLEFDIFAADGTWLAMPGDDVDAGQAKWARITGQTKHTDKDRLLQIFEIVPNACEDLRVTGQLIHPIPNHQIVFERTVPPDTQFEEVIPVEFKAGHAYMAVLLPVREISRSYGVGYTNPVFAVQP